MQAQVCRRHSLSVGSPTSCPLDCSQAVTQRALAQVPVRDCSSVPLSSPDCPCSFCSSLGGCRDCGGATPSPGAPAVPSVAGPHPRAGPGGEAGSLPVNHRPQPLLILSLPAGSFPPSDSWHHASVGLAFHRRSGCHARGRGARCLLEMKGRGNYSHKPLKRACCVPGASVKASHPPCEFI